MGRLAADAAADVVVTNYRPSTALTDENVASHFIFGMGPQHVTDVMIDGRWVVRDQEIVSYVEPEVRREAGRVAADLWRRMSTIE
jgi:cytosine/adenosine deaminase-related metal-dependent hydrolase